MIECLVEQDVSSPQEQALAIAKLGDWYLIFGQRYAAQRTYKLATETLVGADSSDNPDVVLFDKPVRIRFDVHEIVDNQKETTIPNQETDKNMIEIGMTVSRLGGLSKIEVINSAQEITDKQLANIKSNLRNIRFRPKVVDGETVVSSHRDYFQASILER